MKMCYSQPAAQCAPLPSKQHLSRCAVTGFHRRLQAGIDSRVRVLPCKEQHAALASCEQISIAWLSA